MLKSSGRGRERIEISHTDAGGGGEVSFVSHITVAAEGSNGVDALTISTQIWHHLALVDIWKYRNILVCVLFLVAAFNTLYLHSLAVLPKCKNLILFI